MKPPNQEPGSSETLPRGTPTAHPPAVSEGAKDLRLVQRALEGDRASITALVDRLRMIPRVLHCRNRRMGKPLTNEDLEDVAQEILSTIWRRLRSYHGGSPIEAWAYRFCSLTYMNALRSRNRQPFLGDLGEGLEVADPSAAPGDSDPPQVLELLERLSEDQAHPIRLRIYDGLPFQSIAELLKVPLTTAKARYYRGLDALRLMLEAGAEGGRP